MTMCEYTEIVTGRIVERSGGKPVAGAVVEVYDKDLLLDDFLGNVTTDDEGRFRVDFTWADYKDTVFDGRPDIYLKVLNPGTGKKTKSKVFYDLSGVLSDDDSEEVMDLGDIPVD
jgi:hypothetical protein